MTSPGASRATTRGPTRAVTLAPLCCDLCDWPMLADDITLAADGTIPGLIVCTLCIEDNLQSEIAA